MNNFTELHNDLSNSLKNEVFPSKFTFQQTKSITDILTKKPKKCVNISKAAIS